MNQVGPYLGLSLLNVRETELKNLTSFFEVRLFYHPGGFIVLVNRYSIKHAKVNASVTGICE